MAVVFDVCVLIAVISSFRTAIACEGKKLSAIVAVLEEVSDWEDLGYKLDVKERRLKGIEEGCGSGKGRATCCRRDLVKAYCNAMGLVPVETVIGNIAAALDEMDLAKQADLLRLKFSLASGPPSPGPPSPGPPSPGPPSPPPPSPGPPSDTTTPATSPATTPSSSPRSPPPKDVYSFSTEEVFVLVLVGGVSLLLIIYCRHRHKGSKKHLTPPPSPSPSPSPPPSPPPSRLKRKIISPDTSLPHSVHSSSAAMSAPRNKALSGKNTLEYQRFKSHLETIIEALESNPGAFQSLRLKMIEEGWQSTTGKLTEEKLMYMVINRVQLDASQFEVFTTMINDIDGLDLVANKLTSAPARSSGRVSSSSHSTTPPPNRMTDPIFNERVTPLLLGCISYDGGKYLRVVDEVAPHWENLAPQLDLSGPQIKLCETPARDKKTETRAMFQKWMDTVVQHTWRNLLKALAVAGLPVLAERLTNALGNMDP